MRQRCQNPRPWYLWWLFLKFFLNPDALWASFGHENSMGQPTTCHSSTLMDDLTDRTVGGRTVSECSSSYSRHRLSGSAVVLSKTIHIGEPVTLGVQNVPNECVFGRDLRLLEESPNWRRMGQRCVFCWMELQRFMLVDSPLLDVNQTSFLFVFADFSMMCMSRVWGHAGVWTMLGGSRLDVRHPNQRRLFAFNK